MIRFFVATTNAGKLRDFAAAAEASRFSFEPLPGLKEIPVPAEDEPTFEGNARTKAVYYSRFAPGEIVLADDSGLEVDALGGAPGVRSARFAVDALKDSGEVSEILDESARSDTDTLNNLYLLNRLEGVPPGQRRARYRCVLAAVRDGQCIFTGEGTVEGEILIAPQGSGGFGYDPLFYLPDLGKSMAEIDLATKDRISHRGKALRNLLAQISALPH
jgi:XTP/dITP diphosphohydrolase